MTRTRQPKFQDPTKEFFYNHVVRRRTESIEVENIDPFNLPDARGVLDLLRKSEVLG